MQLSYFAEDGNYGSASGLTVIDTTAWTESDWTMLEEASDNQKALTARVVSEWIESGRSDDYKEYFERLGVALGD
jgi:hypothetical protein